MGMEDDVDFDIKDVNLHMEGFKIQPFETFMSESRHHRPEFKLLELGVAAREKQIQLEKKEYLPKLLMGGLVEVGYAPNIIGDEDEDSFSNPFNYKRAGIGFEVSNELDFRKIKAKVKGAEATYLQTIAQKRAAFQGLRVDLKKAYLELIQQQKLVGRANKEMKAARQIVFLTKSNLDIGLGEKKDYLDALQSYLVFQGRKLEAIFNYNTAVATLKQKMGTLYQGQKLVF
jgi:outer membrane protein TolC